MSYLCDLGVYAGGAPASVCAGADESVLWLLGASSGVVADSGC